MLVIFASSRMWQQRAGLLPAPGGVAQSTGSAGTVGGSASSGHLGADLVAGVRPGVGSRPWCATRVAPRATQAAFAGNAPTSTALISAALIGHGLPGTAMAGAGLAGQVRAAAYAGKHAIDEATTTRWAATRLFQRSGPVPDPLPA